MAVQDKLLMCEVFNGRVAMVENNFIFCSVDGQDLSACYFLRCPLVYYFFVFQVKEFRAIRFFDSYTFMSLFFFNLFEKLMSPSVCGGRDLILYDVLFCCCFM